MRVGMATHVGHVREKNEDSMGWRDGLFVVADGMGGHNAGEVASALAVEYILRIKGKSDFRRALKRAVEQANRALLDMAGKDPNCSGMGTTLAVLYIKDDKAVIGHIGDSRVYQWRQGELRRLTRDHSLVEELVANGGITAEQARNHPQRNILTRALGTPNLPEIELVELPIEAGDRFLLCTDGLSGPLSDEEIAAVISEDKSPQELADSLVEQANGKGGPDNVTIIVVEI
ncbi:MAG TPA: Stp1/IreP family PP2C-type Ser/Thr phosphatase [Firmicutes bacterium]|jgi:serine/threonine protein phosphatase PrpC|nr:Stp1/IreP family PP2C-type Ser/Thr phosphatase [Bacillota bacterium]HOQ23649.1 Stp1/IreP family PP2C-type Ser/Thr phosphatase [Bacillota bacterium]HPT67065.1 Stp1/IreP family PP2C-type Ser/Thr phosphatase [Bacillota bacterium]